MCDEADKADGKKRGFVIINQKVGRESGPGLAAFGRSTRMIMLDSESLILLHAPTG